MDRGMMDLDWRDKVVLAIAVFCIMAIGGVTWEWLKWAWTHISIQWR